MSATSISKAAYTTTKKVNYWVATTGSSASDGVRRQSKPLAVDRKMVAVVLCRMYLKVR